MLLLSLRTPLRKGPQPVRPRMVSLTLVRPSLLSELTRATMKAARCVILVFVYKSRVILFCLFKFCLHLISSNSTCTSSLWTVSSYTQLPTLTYSFSVTNFIFCTPSILSRVILFCHKHVFFKFCLRHISSILVSLHTESCLDLAMMWVSYQVSEYFFCAFIPMLAWGTALNYETSWVA